MGGGFGCLVSKSAPAAAPTRYDCEEECQSTRGEEVAGQAYTMRCDAIGLEFRDALRYRTDMSNLISTALWKGSHLRLPTSMSWLS
jgi:hypothetical protein